MTETSFQLLRTNPLLTSNVKIVVDTGYNLYLESYSVSTDLSDVKYKHFAISNLSKYEQMLFKFYDGIPTNHAFLVEDNTNPSSVESQYVNQFDTTYFCGAKNIEDTYYEEEYEYTAPLYIKPTQIPQGFIILRVDGSAIFDPTTSYVLESLDSTNFRTQIIDQWKCVQLYDLSYQSDLGYWLYNNFVNNSQFPRSAFEISIDSNRSVVNNWNGIDIENGVYTSAHESAVNQFYWEQPHFKMEQYVTQGFSRNNLVYPHILNMKFLFDDQPATPFQLNTYSMNRYYGFYLDQLDFITNLTTYNTPALITGLTLVNNIFMGIYQVSGSTCPFATWNPNQTYYIYAFWDLQQVVQVSQDGIIYYQIISPNNVSISDINTDGVVNINFISTGDTYLNLISGKYNQPIEIDPFTDPNQNYRGLYGDLYLIEIDGKYHVLNYQNIPSYNLSGSTVFTGGYSGITDTFINSYNMYITYIDHLEIYDINNNLLNYITGLTPTIWNSVYTSPENVMYAGTSNGIFRLDTYGNQMWLNSGNTNLPGNNINIVYYKDGYLCAGISGNFYTNSWWVGVYGDTSGITNFTDYVYGLALTGTSLVTGFDIYETNLYISYDSKVRKYYNFNQSDFNYNNYFDIDNTNNQTFPYTGVTNVQVYNGSILVSTQNGFWLKNNTLEQYFNISISGTTKTNITDFVVAENDLVYLLIYNNQVSTDGIYSFNYTSGVYTYFQIIESGNSISLYNELSVLVGNNDSYILYNFPDNSQSLSDFEYYIQTDYAIQSDDNTLQYWIVSSGNTLYSANTYYTNQLIYDGVNKPLTYPVYRLKFTDIKDFDFDRVNTHFSDFDYEQTEYVITDEDKLNVLDYTTTTYPLNYRLMPDTTSSQGLIMNVSSEYIADDEIFEIINVNSSKYQNVWNMNDMWTKSQSINKWGFTSSISHSDYIYKLNNSHSVGFDYNRTTNYNYYVADVVEKNLDYMYRIGDFYDYQNSQYSRYLQQSTNIETSLMNYDSSKFNIGYYLAGAFDYFDYFFSNYMTYQDNTIDYIKATQKYSLFNNYNMSLFKGILYSIQGVDELTFDPTNGEITSIKYNTTSYDNYKFSVIFNPAYNYFYSNPAYSQPQSYTGQSIVLWYDPLYLDAWYTNDSFISIEGFDSGITYGFNLNSNTYTALTYYQESGVSVNLFQVWDESLVSKSAQTLAYKRLGYLYLQVPYILSPYTFSSSYYFTGVNTNGDFVLFSGNTYYMDTNGDITPFYVLSASTNKTFISLYQWDETDFISNINNWFKYNLIYQSNDSPVYTSGGIMNNSIIDNSQNGIHVILNDQYENILIIVNHAFNMYTDYIDLNNVSAFGETYGFYNGLTLHNQPLFSNFIPYWNINLAGSNMINISYTNLSSTTYFSSIQIINGSNNTPGYNTYYSNPISVYAGNNIDFTFKSNFTGSDGISTTGSSFVIQIDTGYTGSYYILTSITYMSGISISTYDQSSIHVGTAGNIQLVLTQNFNGSGGTWQITAITSASGYSSSSLYDPSLIIASRYFNSFNWLQETIDFDQNITYHHIDSAGTYSYYQITQQTGCTYLVSTFPAKEIKLKAESYDTTPLKGPDYNIYDKFVPPGQRTNKSYDITQPLSRKININNQFPQTRPQVHGEQPVYEKSIYRFEGTYEPVFKNLEIFSKSNYASVNNNFYFYDSHYTFGDQLYENFGTMEELIQAKVNPQNSSVLKLANTTSAAIFPMVDEYGLSYNSRFIFKSSWDAEFFTKTLNSFTKLL